LLPGLLLPPACRYSAAAQDSVSCLP